MGSRTSFWKSNARAINRLCPALSAVNFPLSLRSFSSLHQSNSVKILYRYGSQTGTAGNLPLSLRSFSSAKQFNSVKVLYGSQTGTAQLFAIQLADEISDIADDISCAAIDSAASPSDVVSTDSANIFVTSVAGVGEPPDNARNFYEWLHTDEAKLKSDIKYAVFGCGNKVAHPNNYNVVSKYIDGRLEELGGKRIVELGLGDDGDCIDDDWDIWSANLIEALSRRSDDVVVPETANGPTDDPTTIKNTNEVHGDFDECSASKSNDGKRRVSPSYPKLDLRVIDDGENDLPRSHLFDEKQPKLRNFYASGTKLFQMISNKGLRSTAGEHTMCEMVISEKDVSYQAGDHLVVYPHNARCVVDAYLEILDVKGSTIIGGVKAPQNESGERCTLYRFPIGLTIEETLLHCCDLSATPSPAFARHLLGRDDVNYRDEVADPQRTVLELIKESGFPVALEELLFNLPVMQPRYYSIASSPLENKDKIYLTYRPVKYMTSRGILREGLCSNFMKDINNTTEDSKNTPYIVAAIKSNPSFRLPQDDSTPILLVAGGCGVAPIRAFIEERSARIKYDHANLGDAYVYLGFRSPNDEVYHDFFQNGLKSGAITEAHISYTKGCTNPSQVCQFVSDTLRAKGEFVVQHMEKGGHIFLCGGARVFGAAMQQVLVDVLQEQKRFGVEEAEEYLRDMLRSGRLVEDLAD